MTFHVPKPSFHNQGSDRQGSRLGLSPNPQCTKPFMLSVPVGANRMARLCRQFRLSPTGPHGCRPSHEVLTHKPQPWASWMGSWCSCGPGTLAPFACLTLHVGPICLEKLYQEQNAPDSIAPEFIRLHNHNKVTVQGGGVLVPHPDLGEAEHWHLKSCSV